MGAGKSTLGNKIINMLNNNLEPPIKFETIFKAAKGVKSVTEKM